MTLHTPQIDALRALVRAREALAMADAADDPRDKQAFKAAAYAWERIATSRVTFSVKPLRQSLEALKADVAAPAPVSEPRYWITDETHAAVSNLRESVAIEF